MPSRGGPDRQPTVWVKTDTLMAAMPGPRATQRRVLSVAGLSGGDLPAEVPFEQAVAFAAAMEAHSRGVSRTKAVFDVVLLHRRNLNGQLLVRPRGRGEWRLVPAVNFAPGPFIVIEFDEVIDRVRQCVPLSG
jgi:hypothetical protein